MERLYQDPKWLYDQYWIEALSIREIAILARVASCTILKWMKKYGIPRRSYKEAWNLAISSGRMNLEIRSQKHSERMKKAWAGGKYKEAHSSLEFRERQAQKTRENWGKGIWDDPDCIAKRAAKISEAWAAGRYDGVFLSPTSIEIATRKALDQLKIKHESQYRPSGYSCVFDEFVPPNSFIEIHGDYWHGYPKMFPVLNETQKEHIARDVKKAKWAFENGYDLIVIWEHEIKEHGALAILEERL